MPTRRQVLASVAGLSTAGMIGTFPTAVSSGTLQAELSVVDSAADFTGDVGFVDVEIRNLRPPDGEPIEPVILMWSQGRNAQIPWFFMPRPPEPVAPQESRRYSLRAPGRRRSVRLGFGYPALVRLFDKGTEKRTHHVHTPTAD